MASEIIGFGRQGVIDDGDWSVVRPCSPALLEYPFQHHGDRQTFIVRQRFQVDAAYFVPAAINSRHGLYPTALLIEESPHREFGGGKIEWERTWATLPLTRNESESFVYEYQYITPSLELGGRSFPINSTVTYEYFLRGQEDTLPLATAPRVVRLNGRFYKLGTGNLARAGYVIVSIDETILAESDTYGDWKGAIRFRKRRTIPGPTAAFWASELNVAI